MEHFWERDVEEAIMMLRSLNYKDFFGRTVWNLGIANKIIA